MTDFMHEQHDDSDIAAGLSETGRARRDTILHIATAHMTARRRQLHRRRRIVAAGAMSIALVLVAVVAVTPQRPETPPTVANGSEIPLSPPNLSDESTAIDLKIVHSDERILDRYRAHTPPRTIELTDDELVGLLADVDRPTGLINIDGQARLTNHVTDLPANETGDDSKEPPPV